MEKMKCEREIVGENFEKKKKKKTDERNNKKNVVRKFCERKKQTWEKM
jgi:hypothetical protein